MPSPSACRLDLAAIEHSLRQIQARFAAINADLLEPRDELNDGVIHNMLLGYRLVDRYVAEGANLFALDRVDGLLEINNTVLCGTDPAQRREFARSIAATERRFYDQDEGGIADFFEWYAAHHADSVWERAAGALVRVLSKPQLFIEGNHRSAALIMSYILMREGRPPFVLSVDNAAAYFNPSSAIRNTRKKSLATRYRLARFERRCARFLETQADPGFVLDGVSRGVRA